MGGRGRRGRNGEPRVEKVCGESSKNGLETCVREQKASKVEKSADGRCAPNATPNRDEERVSPPLTKKRSG